jgi:hypothetical protein
MIELVYSGGKDNDIRINVLDSETFVGQKEKFLRDKVNLTEIREDCFICRTKESVFIFVLQSLPA